MVNFSLFNNDPFYRLLSKLGLNQNNGRPKIFLTILLIIGLAWLIPAILSSFQGVAINPEPRLSFLFDFAAYSQFLMAIPLLIIAEPYIDEAIERGVNHLYQTHMLSSIDRNILEGELNKASELLARVDISVICIIIAFIMGGLYAYGEFTNGASNWHSIAPENVIGLFENPTLAGWWNALVSQTLLIYFILRWVWKIAIWYWVIRQISKCELQLHASHPDRFGGIGFFLSIQSRFSLLILAIGITIAATNAYKIVIEKSPFTFFSTTMLGAILYFLIAPILFISPLFFFSPVLSKTKRNSLLTFSTLALKNSMRIDELIANKKEKLSDNKSGMDENNLLKLINIDDEGSSEIVEKMKILASVNDHYECIQKMHTIPIDIQRTGRMFIAGLSPLIPLLIQSTIFSKIGEYFLRQ